MIWSVKLLTAKSGWWIPSFGRRDWLSRKSAIYGKIVTWETEFRCLYVHSINIEGQSRNYSVWQSNAIHPTVIIIILINPRSCGRTRLGNGCSTLSRYPTWLLQDTTWKEEYSSRTFRMGWNICSQSLRPCSKTKCWRLIWKASRHLSYRTIRPESLSSAVVYSWKSEGAGFPSSSGAR